MNENKEMILNYLRENFTKTDYLIDENLDYLLEQDFEEIKEFSFYWLNWLIQHFLYKDYLKLLRKNSHSLEEKEEIYLNEVSNFKTVWKDIKEFLLNELSIKDFLKDQKYWIFYIFEKYNREKSNISFEKVKDLKKEEFIRFLFKWFSTLTDDKKNLLMKIEKEDLFELRNLRIWTLVWKLQVDEFIKNLEKQDKQEVIKFFFNRYYQFNDELMNLLSKLSNREIELLKWTPANLLRLKLKKKEYDSILNEKDLSNDEKDLILREELWKNYLLLNEDNKSLLRNNFCKVLKLINSWINNQKEILDILDWEIINQNKLNDEVQESYELIKTNWSYSIYKSIWEISYCIWKRIKFDWKNENEIKESFDNILKNKKIKITENNIERILYEKIYWIDENFDKNNDYLTSWKLAELIEMNLNVEVKKEFPNKQRDEELIQKYSIYELSKKFDIAFEFNSKLFLVEFDWIQHFTDLNSIVRDKKIRDKYRNLENIELIEIPYFIQLNKQTSEMYFWKKFHNFELWKKDLSKYQHWFISDFAINTWTPAHFPVLWLRKFVKILDNIPENIKNDIKGSMNRIVENWIKEKYEVFSWYQWY